MIAIQNAINATVPTIPPIVTDMGRPSYTAAPTPNIPQDSRKARKDPVVEYMLSHAPLPTTTISRQDSSKASSDVQDHQSQDPDYDSVLEPPPSETTTVPTNDISRQDSAEAISNLQDHQNHDPDNDSVLEPQLSETTPAPTNEISHQDVPESSSDIQDHQSQDTDNDSGKGQQYTTGTPMPPNENVRQDSSTAGSDKQVDPYYPDEYIDEIDTDHKASKTLLGNVQKFRPNKTTTTTTTKAPGLPRLGNNTNDDHPGKSSADSRYSGLRNAIFKLLCVVLTWYLVFYHICSTQWLSVY